MFFFLIPSMNYSGVIVQGRSLLSLVVKGIPWGQLTRASCSVGKYSGKAVLGGELPKGEFHGSIVQRGNYSGVIICGVKEVIVLGEFHRSQLSRGDYSVIIVQELITLRNFMGSSCQVGKWWDTWNYISWTS